jgi:hypothetical protein
VPAEQHWIYHTEGGVSMDAVAGMVMDSGKFAPASGKPVDRPALLDTGHFRLDADHGPSLTGKADADHVAGE